jgi:hypothetical protein
MNELLPRHFDYYILTLTSFRSTTFDRISSLNEELDHFMELTRRPWRSKFSNLQDAQPRHPYVGWRQ